MRAWSRRAAAFVLAVGLCSSSFAEELGDNARLVEQGAYLVTAANCVSCHTAAGRARFAGGVAFRTPFGTVYSTNITPDLETGIGRWTEADFVRAMREGVRPDGEHLYPVFPYTSFTKLTDSDVKAMFAYLQTVPAVRYRAPANEMPVPFRWRWSIGVWKALFFESQRYLPDKARSAEWNRGAYIVQALGHCGACHSPRNLFGAERSGRELTGGSHLDEVPGGAIRRWSAVDLTPAPAGLRSWTEQDITDYLGTGVNAYATAFGPMNAVIMNSTRHLSQADLRAIAVYLKALLTTSPSQPPEPDPAEMSTGEMLYSVHCGTCHLPTGLGAAATGPRLVGNPVVLASDPASLINVILYGPELPEEPLPIQREHMEGYAGKLIEEEVAALATYLRNAWGHRASPVSVRDIAEQS